MKHTIIIFFVAILLYVDCNAQQAIFPASHRMTVYLDNIIVSNIISGNEPMVNIDKIPCVLYDNYYSKHIGFSTNDTLSKTIESKIVKKFFIEKDTILNKNSLHIRTKKAKDGYLFVNKSIMDKIAGLDLDKLKVSYVYNNRVATTKEDVMRIIKLRKKRIQISEILQEEQSGMITVYIIDK